MKTDPNDIVGNLTKLEFFTATAMQGIITGRGDGRLDIPAVGVQAVLLAKAAIDALNAQEADNG